MEKNINNELLNKWEIVNRKQLLGMIIESTCLANILSFANLKVIQGVQWIYKPNFLEKSKQ